MEVFQKYSHLLPLGVFAKTWNVANGCVPNKWTNMIKCCHWVYPKTKNSNCKNFNQIMHSYNSVIVQIHFCNFLALMTGLQTETLLLFKWKTTKTINVHYVLFPRPKFLFDYVVSQIEKYMFWCFQHHTLPNSIFVHIKIHI